MGSSDERKGQQTGLESARKVLAILLEFSDEHPRLTIAQIAERVGLPVSSTYRYVSLLRQMNLLEEGSGPAYQVTPLIAPIARAAHLVNDLATISRETMDAIAGEVDETVLLTRNIGGFAVVVASAETTNVVRMALDLGVPRPLGLGASGKILLNQLSPDERRTYLDRRCRMDPSLAERRVALEAELDQVRAQGWAESLGEVDTGVWACAVPIGDAHLGGALAVAGPAYRVDSSVRERIHQVLSREAEPLTHKINNVSSLHR